MLSELVASQLKSAELSDPPKTKNGFLRFGCFRVSGTRQKLRPLPGLEEGADEGEDNRPVPTLASVLESQPGIMLVVNKVPPRCKTHTPKVRRRVKVWGPKLFFVGQVTRAGKQVIEPLSNSKEPIKQST